MTIDTLSTRFCLLATSLLIMVAIITGCKGKKSHSDDEDDEDEPRTENASGSSDVDRLLAEFPPYPNVNDYHPDGHSQAFEIHPRPELTISAPAGAFEEDVRIEVTDVPETTMQRLRQQFDEDNYGELLWAYDIDAGLPPDSVIPGKYTVSMDLKKKKVPEELYPYLQAVRVGANGRIEVLNSHIEGDRLVYHASKNSITAVSALTYIAVTTATVLYLVKYPAINQGFRKYWDAYSNDDWYRAKDVVAQHVDDSYGSFIVFYRYSDTENNMKTKEYVKAREDLAYELNKIRADAYLQFYDEHPHARQGGEGTDEWVAMGVAALAEKMKRESAVIRNVQESGILELPQSVREIVEDTKMSHRFTQNELKMKPLSVEYTLYLSPMLDAFKEEAYRTRYIYFDPFVVLNYERIVFKNDSTPNAYQENVRNDTRVTLTHETMHVYQTEYIDCQAFKDQRFLEAMGAVSEYRYARWLSSKRLIMGNPFNSGNMTMYSNRRKKEYHSWPLAYSCPASFGAGQVMVNVEAGYVMADLLDYMNDNKEEKNFEQMMQGYSYLDGFLGSLKAVWGIGSDQAFVQYFEKFCQKYAKDICDRQSSFSNNPANAHLVIRDREHSPGMCVVRLKGSDFGYDGKQKAYAFSAKSVKLTPKQLTGSNQDLPYTLFAVPSPRVKPGELRFTFLEGSDMAFAQNPHYIKPCSGGNVAKAAYGLLMTRPGIEGETLDDSYYIDIVALYKPQQEPQVKGMSNDGTGLIVDTRVAPAYELKRNHLITGMQILVTNNKTGLYKGFSVDLDHCGQEVKIPYEKIGVTDKGDVDVTMQARWYYEYDPGKNYYSPATDKVNYKLKDEQEQQDTQQTTPGEEVDPDSQEESGEDYGEPVLLDAKFLIKSIAHCGIKSDTKLYGRLVLTKDHFTINVPAYHWPFSDPAIHQTRDNASPALEIKGKCDVNFT
ncbi:MAG: hypothetical protein K6G08_06740, partial [Prevotella sp.]|nr:hypothetical protein [Prevotella sp.]